MRSVVRRHGEGVVICVLALVVVVLWGAAAHAATVTPTAAVTNYVNVRESASAQSAKKGKLAPGETAEELESVPHWFKVKLTDGTVGFVSKAWVTETGTPPPVIV